MVDLDLTPRECFLTAVRGGQPDRVPMFDFLFSPALYQELLGHHPGDYNTPDAVALTRALGLDAVVIFWEAPRGRQDRWLNERDWIDEWGVTWRRDWSVSWPTGAPIGFPVHDRSDWRNYTVPAPRAPGRADSVREAVSLSQGELAVLGTVLGPFTAVYQITGLERFCTLIYDDPDLLQEMAVAFTDFYIEIGRAMLDAGADVLLVADDHAGTAGPFISLHHWRTLVLPHFTRLVRTFRNWGATVLMHNDGDLRLYLDDLVATGINGYHPVERNAGMNLAEIRARHGERLCLVGNVNNKTTMVHGTPADIEREVIECLRVAGRRGAYVLATDHSLHDGMPVDNILALFQAGRRYGRYPLKLPAGSKTLCEAARNTPAGDNRGRP